MLKKNKEVENRQTLEHEHEPNIFRSEPLVHKQSTSVQTDNDKNRYKEEDKFLDPFSSASKSSPQTYSSSEQNTNTGSYSTNHCPTPFPPPKRTHLLQKTPLSSASETNKSPPLLKNIFRLHFHPLRKLYHPLTPYKIRYLLL